MHLLNSTLHTENDSFNLYEQKLLLLALTHRLCSIYNRKLVAKLDSIGHKNEIFMRLIQLIEQHYTQKRSVDFYADKLCLSPKYLSDYLNLFVDTPYKNSYSSPLSAKAFHCSKIPKRTSRKSPMTYTSPTHLTSVPFSENKPDYPPNNSVKV